MGTVLLTISQPASKPVPAYQRTCPLTRTLAGQGYTGAMSTAGTMSEVLQYLRDRVAAATGPIEVRNPANDDELLSEQWEKSPAAYREFNRWLAWFTNEWSQVMAAQRVPELHRLLSTLFGEDVAIDAIKKHAAQTMDLRRSSQLKVQSSGAMTSAAGAAVVRANTFYGDE